MSTLPAKQKKTVGVDFDGVLHNYVGSDKFGTPIPQGLRLLRALLNRGYEVVIVTARPDVQAAQQWLQKQGFGDLWVTNQKVPACAYIDDRAVPWPQDVGAVLKRVENLSNTWSK